MSPDTLSAPVVPEAGLERYATGRWLEWPLMAFVASLMVAGIVFLLAYTIGLGHGTLDPMGRPIGTDFSGVYTAGRMALAGHAADIYDWSLHDRAQEAFHQRPGVDFYGWHYPPYFLLLMICLAPLPYLVALALWQGVTLAALAVLVQRILPGRRALLMTIGFPAVFVCIGHGHNGFLTASLLTGALLVLDRRPILAGILIGCLAYKPQFGIVVPVALVFGGYWRAVFSAGATIAALTLATLGFWGLPIWQAFLGSGQLTRTIVLEQGATGWQKIVSTFSWIRMLGGSVDAAYVGQGLVTIAVVAIVAWLWKSRADMALKGAALMIATVMSTPYALDYDLVVIGPAIAFLAARGLKHGFQRWEKTALAFAWIAPILTRPIGAYIPVQTALIAMIILLVMIVRTVRADAAGAASAPATAAA